MLQISDNAKIDDQDKKIDIYVLLFKIISFKRYTFSKCAGSDLVKERFGKVAAHLRL